MVFLKYSGMGEVDDGVDVFSGCGGRERATGTDDETGIVAVSGENLFSLGAHFVGRPKIENAGRINGAKKRGARTKMSDDFVKGSGVIEFDGIKAEGRHFIENQPGVAANVEEVRNTVETGFIEKLAFAVPASNSLSCRIGMECGGGKMRVRKLKRREGRRGGRIGRGLRE